MKTAMIVKQAIALVALTLTGACISFDNPNDSSTSSAARERVNANAVGQSVAAVFANMGNGQAGLHADESEEPSASYACLEGEYNEDGLTLSNDVPEGHYGVSDNGFDIESVNCNETGLIYWEFEDVTGEDCTGGEMTISAGSGILAFGTTEDGESAMVVLGSYTVEGLEVACDIVITESSLSVTCEIDGEELEADSCEASDEAEDDSDWQDEDDSTSDSDDTSDEGYDSTSDSNADCPPDESGSHDH